MWFPTVVGLFFFYETITATWYQLIVQDFIVPFEINKRDASFQQNGASTYTVGSTLNMLQEFFGDRVISKGLWPP